MQIYIAENRVNSHENLYYVENNYLCNSLLQCFHIKIQKSLILLAKTKKTYFERHRYIYFS